MDEFLQAVQNIDPLWSVVLVAVALVVLVIARFWRASFVRILAVLVALAIVGSAATAAYYGYEHFEETRRLAERRALDERAVALFQQSVQPGSVFACIDGSPVPSLMEACEENLFAEPQRVAAAVAVVTQRLAFLSDATEYAKERDPTYLARTELIRKALENDPFGLVAFVLSVEHNCTADSCKRLEILRDTSRVTENMRVRRLEAFLAKHSAGWGSSFPSAAAQPETPAPSMPKTSPFVSISEPVTAPVNVPPIAEPVPVVSSPSTPAVETPVVAAPAAAAVPPAAPPSEAAKEKPRPEAASAPSAAAKGAASAPASPAAAQAKNPPPSRPAAAPPGQPKSKAKGDPVTRRSSEPVAGLPRIVPRDFVREKEEPEEEPTAQASGQSTQPGPPTSIMPPQQNFTVQ